MVFAILELQFLGRRVRREDAETAKNSQQRRINSLRSLRELCVLCVLTKNVRTQSVRRRRGERKEFGTESTFVVGETILIPIQTSSSLKLFSNAVNLVSTLTNENSS